MFQVRRSVRGLRRRVGHGRDAAHARVPVGVAVRVPGGGGGRGGGVRALQRALLQRVRRAAARAPPAGGCRVPEGPWPGVTSIYNAQRRLQAHYLSAPPLIDLHKNGEHSGGVPAVPSVPSVPSVGFGGFC